MDKSIRVLLINAINARVEVETRYPSLGLAYLASSARKNVTGADIQFKIVDKNIPSAAKEFKPHLVGISSVSQNFNIAIKYSNFFSTLGIPVIMGGIHISSLPETLPLTATVGCIGEGEYSFVKIIKVFLENSLGLETLACIPGIIFWDAGKLRKTTEIVPENNLDLIPLPARDLLPINSHAYMFTSRGCPYRCTFCASSRFWNKLRFFSAEYVVSEIEQLISDYNVKMISFFDDLFVADRQRLEKILHLLEKRNIRGRVKFTCNCRANLVDKELANILFRMGVVSANMGFESASDEMLRFLKGGMVSVAHNLEAITILKNAGIAVNGSFIIGSPKETKEQIMQTYNFIRKTKLDLFDIYLLTPFPGTPVWDYAKKRNLISDDMRDWSRLDMNTYRLSEEQIIVLSEMLTKKEIIALYKKFLHLRFWRNMIKVLTHPMINDVPIMAYKLLKEFSHKLFKTNFSCDSECLNKPVVRDSVKKEYN